MGLFEDVEEISASVEVSFGDMAGAVEGQIPASFRAAFPDHQTHPGFHLVEILLLGPLVDQSLDDEIFDP